MAFTEKELEFIENNRELLEKGKTALPEIMEKLFDSSSIGVLRSRLVFAIIFSIEGKEGFTAKVTSRFKTSVVNGAILNRTSATTKGVALLPSMFNAKTKIVFYRIENNKIAEESNSKLIDPATYKKELAEGNYNLVILDTKANRDSVKEAFSGVKIYTTSVVVKEIEYKGVLLTTEVASTDPESAKDQTKKESIETLVSRFEGMRSAVTSVINYTIDKIDFE